VVGFRLGDTLWASFMWSKCSGVVHPLLFPNHNQPSHVWHRLLAARDMVNPHFGVKVESVVAVVSGMIIGGVLFHLLSLIPLYRLSSFSYPTASIMASIPLLTAYDLV
jgi:hypothetical protein